MNKNGQETHENYSKIWLYERWIVKLLWDITLHQEKIVGNPYALWAEVREVEPW